MSLKDEPFYSVKQDNQVMAWSDVCELLGLNPDEFKFLSSTVCISKQPDDELS